MAAFNPRRLPVPYEDNYWNHYLWLDALIDNGYYYAEFGERPRAPEHDDRLGDEVAAEFEQEHRPCR